MKSSDQEGFRTIEWIMNKSEQGMFLIVAEEEVQAEIVEAYGREAADVYDCKVHSGEYSFGRLSEWIENVPGVGTIFIANFQYAVESEPGMKRLNFSRDMLAELGRNLIFLITPYGDDNLAAGAADFYSFMKLRIIFSNDPEEEEKEKPLPCIEDDVSEGGWEPEEARERMRRTYFWQDLAKEAYGKRRYKESEQLLLNAKKVREKLLGGEHLEMASIYYDLAEVYEKEERYTEAAILYFQAWQIRKTILGLEHPETEKVLKMLYGMDERSEIWRRMKLQEKRMLAYMMELSKIGEKQTDTMEADDAVCEDGVGD